MGTGTSSAIALAVVEKARDAKATGARRGAFVMVVRSIVIDGSRVLMIREPGEEGGWWLDEGIYLAEIGSDRVTSMA